VAVGTGTGFVWDEHGHIVTNFHVIANSMSQAEQKKAVALVTVADDPKRYEAYMVGFAAYKDLAVLKIDVPSARMLRPLALGSSHDLKVGQRVYAIGNPFGFDRSMTTGIISALGREIESVLRTTITDVIQSDAAINPGNSGGPLLDSSGRLIGVNTAIYSQSGGSAGISFAIPVDTVLKFVPDLIEHGRVRAPVLGIEMDEKLQRNFGLSGVGVMVVDVREGSGAAKAGLVGIRESRHGDTLLGDIIVKVAGRETPTPRDLQSVLQDFSPGQVVEVEVLRNFGADDSRGQRLVLKVELQEMR
jgi:S1-C subfamily serine protease